MTRPDTAWAGDITFIATDEGWLFLAVVIDLFSRQVGGGATRPDMYRDIVIDALRMVWFKRHPDKHVGLIFQTDRGNQYASPNFRAVLKDYGIGASISRQWQLLGQCLQRDTVRIIEGRTPARPTLPHPPPCER